ncbi:MAG: MaoC family dehydratase N-terminal domain-containing protein [Nocardioides sp.]
MPVDQSLVGREFPRPRRSRSPRSTGQPAAAVGTRWLTRPAPATYPIVLAFGRDESLPRRRAGRGCPGSHGEQRFAYTRPVVPGDVLTARLTVVSLYGRSAATTSSAPAVRSPTPAVRRCAP